MPPSVQLPAGGVIRGARMVAAFAPVSDNYNNQPNTPGALKCPQMPPNDPGEYVAPNLDKIELHQLLLNSNEVTTICRVKS